MSFLSIGNQTVEMDSKTKIAGFQVITAKSGGAVTHQYKFIKFMTQMIYERIFYSALNALALSDEQRKVIMPSAADRYTPHSKGFIHYLAKAAATQSKITIYGVKLSGGEWRFSDSISKANEENKEYDLTTELDFEKFNESALVASIVNMMFSTLDATATGLKASKTILMKLEKLADHIADKKTVNAVAEQIKSFDEAVKGGSVAFTSSGSTAEFMKFDTDPSEKAMNFCFGLLSTITAYPAEFFNGLGGSAMSDTGATTEKAIHRADTHYATSVVIPFISEVFNTQVNVKPLITNIESLAGIITFVETTEMLSEDEKRLVLSNFGLSGDGSGIKANNDIQIGRDN